jgi:GWxTD domain-containing protein
MLRSALAFGTCFKVLLTIISPAFFLASCTTSSGLADVENETIYSAEVNFFEPDLEVFHVSGDSSRIIITIKPEELLYSRLESNSPFTSEISFRYLIQSRIDNEKSLVDSASIRFTDERYNASTRLVQFTHMIALPPGDWFISTNIEDLKRGTLSSQSVLSTKSEKLNSDDFAFSLEGSSFFESNYSIPQNTNIQVKCPRHENQTLYLFHYQPEIKLSTAPFSANYPEIPSFKDFKLIQTDSSGSGQFFIEKGLYFISNSATEPIGISVFSTPNRYPSVRNADQLVGPLRFITTKAEFDEISKSRFPKEKVDAFWIESGGGKDKAQNLILEYYSRVEEANTYFSTYTEGWRTDRGMIHLIFGPPTSVKINEESQTWIYGDENSSASLRFTFSKIKTPFSDNVFILNRDVVYKSYWENMVAAWRGGRIYN